MILRDPRVVSRDCTDSRVVNLPPMEAQPKKIEGGISGGVIERTLVRVESKENKIEICDCSCK